MASFLAELQRRHVYKVGAMYAVAGWLIVQVVTQVFPVFNVPALVLQIIVLAIVAGFPVSLVLAWVFDITPAGVVRVDGEARQDSATPVTALRRERRLNVILAALLLAALGLFAADHFLIARRATVTAGDADVSIAVLPLINESSDAENEYFSDGLSEELINELSQIGPLRVISRASSFQFKGKNEDPKSVGEKLGVQHLLEGSVRKDGTHLRIVAEMIDTRDGTRHWSQTYDRDLKDIFSLQSEIAQSVVAALKLKLLGKLALQQDDAPPDHNVEAYNSFLQGNFYVGRGTEVDFRKAIAAYDNAVRLDPNYALAHARLSDAWSALADQMLSGPAIAQAYATARASAQLAIALDPKVARGHSALGWLLMNVDWNLPAAEAEMRQSLMLAPNDPGPKNDLAAALANQGHFEEAVAVTRQGISLDPLGDGFYQNLGIYLTALGRYDEATAAIRKAIDLQPSASINYSTLAVVDIKRADAAAALRDAQREPDEFWRTYATALAYWALGDHAASDTALQALLAKDAEDGAYQIAHVYAFRGDTDAAFQWLDRAYGTHDTGVIGLRISPFFSAYADDPRYLAFCKKVGLPLSAHS